MKSKRTRAPVGHSNCRRRTAIVELAADQRRPLVDVSAARPEFWFPSFFHVLLIYQMVRSLCRKIAYEWLGTLIRKKHGVLKRATATRH